MRRNYLYFVSFVCLAISGWLVPRNLVAAVYQGGQGPSVRSNESPHHVSDDAHESYLAHIAAANSALRLHEAGEAKRWLSQAPGDHQSWEWRYLNSRSDSSVGRIETAPWIPGRIDLLRDGGSIAVAGADGWVRIYDVVSKKLSRSWPTGSEYIYTARFSPTGDYVATCSRDGQIALWNAADGTAVWKGHSSGQGLADVAFSPNGSELAFCSWYRQPEGVIGIVSTWNVASGTEKWKTHFGVKPIVSVRYSPDGSRLAVGTWDSLVGVWNTSDLDAEPAVFDFKDAESYAAIDEIAFSPGGNRIAAASKSGSPRVWDLVSGKLLKDLDGHSSAVFSVAFESESRLATGGSDGTIQIWDLDKGTCDHRYFGHENRITSIAVAGEKAIIISSSADSTIRFWDLNDSRGFSPHDRGEQIYGMSVSLDGKLLAAGGMNDTDVYVWDISTRELKHRLKGLTGSVNYLAFGPDSLVAGGNWDGDVFVWNASTGEQVCHLKEAGTGGMSQCSFRSDGKKIAVATNQNQAVIWDVDQRKVDQRIKFDSGIAAVEFSPSSAMLLVGSSSGRVHGISTANWQEEWTQEIASSPIRDLSFSPDEKQIVAGCESGRLVVVNVADRRIAWEHQAHSERIWTVSTTKDGRYAVTGSADRLAKFWDLERGCSVLTFADATEVIYNIVCSPTSEDIFVSSSGKELFQLRPGPR